MRRGKLTAVIAALAGTMAFSGSAWALAAVTTANVNLREGPGTRYRVLTVLPPDTAVDVGGCNRGWCLTRVDDLTGWVSERYLAGLVNPPVIGESYFIPIFPGYYYPYWGRWYRPHAPYYRHLHHRWPHPTPTARPHGFHHAPRHMAPRQFHHPGAGFRRPR